MQYPVQVEFACCGWIDFSIYLSACKCHLRLASSDKCENNFRYLKKQNNKENIYIYVFLI